LPTDQPQARVVESSRLGAEFGRTRERVGAPFEREDVDANHQVVVLLDDVVLKGLDLCALWRVPNTPEPHRHAAELAPSTSAARRVMSGAWST